MKQQLRIGEKMAKYFECSFKTEGSEGFKENQNWSPIEPSPYPCEIGRWHWVNCRNAIAHPDMNAGRIRLVRDPTDNSRLCLMMSLETENPTGDQAVKLFEVQQYEPYPIPETGLYYRCRFWLPSNFKVGGWRLLMQWGDANAPVEPQYPTLNIAFQPNLEFSVNRAFDPLGEQRVFSLGYTPETFPKERWVNIAVYIKPSDKGVRNGIVQIKIDGALVLDRSDICTNVADQKSFEWAIGCYGGKEEAYGQYGLYKDVVVSDIETDVKPTHILIITTATGGTTDPAPERYDYEEGTSAVVTAIPDASYRFVQWELDGTIRTENPITIIMNRDYSLRAVFEALPPPPPEKRYLTIVAINGQTNPTPNTYEVDVDTTITVTATPNSGYKFKEWLLDNVQAGTEPFITVTMDVNHTLVALFEKIQIVQAGFPIWTIPVVLLGAGVLYLATKKK
jgi:hypothetical protein